MHAMLASLSWAVVGFLFWPCPSTAAYVTPSSPTPTTNLASDDAISRNAFRIFNAVHSAARQWGSSLDHNGMSYFLVTVPENSIFFHGTGMPDAGIPGRPTGFEWLAFEIEHAQAFARSWEPGYMQSTTLGPISPKAPGDGGPEPSEGLGHDLLRYDAHGAKSLLSSMSSSSVPRNGQQQQPMSLDDDHTADDDRGRPGGPPLDRAKPRRGYLQTYRATRPLNLLYIDGMAAGKSAHGTLDSQDYVLLGWDEDKGPPSGGMLGEIARAGGLCALADEWAAQDSDGEGGQGRRRIDGFVRMEAGFEIIYCHFEEGGGLDLASVDATPFHNETGFVGGGNTFEWVHACSLRYHGFPAGRISVDWSSMVSAFFFGLNLTNPDAAKSELPRIINTARTERETIKSRVREMVGERLPIDASEPLPIAINWQGIVDMIVTRYADRLARLGSGTLSVVDMRHQVNFLLSPFFSKATTDPAALPSLERCKSLYLTPALALKTSWTREDAFIYTALETVSEHICSGLIDMWKILNGVESEDGSEVDRPQQILQDLVSRLAWSRWRECGRCDSLDEVCFVAMFPFGSAEDHYAPKCKTAAGLAGIGAGPNYWMPSRGGPGPR